MQAGTDWKKGLKRVRTELCMMQRSRRREGVREDADGRRPLRARLIQ